MYSDTLSDDQQMSTLKILAKQIKTGETSEIKVGRFVEKCAQSDYVDTEDLPTGECPAPSRAVGRLVERVLCADSGVGDFDAEDPTTKIKLRGTTGISSGLWFNQEDDK